MIHRPIHHLLELRLQQNMFIARIVETLELEGNGGRMILSQQDQASQSLKGKLGIDQGLFPL